MRLTVTLLTVMVLVASYLAYDRGMENAQLKQTLILVTTAKPVIKLFKDKNGDVYIMVDGKHTYLFKNACGVLKT